MWTHSLVVSFTLVLELIQGFHHLKSPFIYKKSLSGHIRVS